MRWISSFSACEKRVPSSAPCWAPPQSRSSAPPTFLYCAFRSTRRCRPSTRHIPRWQFHHGRVNVCSKIETRDSRSAHRAGAPETTTPLHSFGAPAESVVPYGTPMVRRSVRRRLVRTIPREVPCALRDSRKRALCYRFVARTSKTKPDGSVERRTIRPVRRRNRESADAPEPGPLPVGR